jgi:hypothetical protein
MSSNMGVPNKNRRVKLLREVCAPEVAQIHHGDALAFLRSLEDSSAHLVFLDPPFNLGKTYGPKATDSLSPVTYASWMREILSESVRILAEGGSLYLYHIPAWALSFGEFLKGYLTFKHWIAVSMKNGFVRGQRLLRTMLYCFLPKGNLHPSKGQEFHSKNVSVEGPRRTMAGIYKSLKAKVST